MGKVQIPWGWVIGTAILALVIDHHVPGVGQFVGGISDNIFRGAG